MSGIPDSIPAYLRAYANELEGKVLAEFPPLHAPSDPVRPVLGRLKRKPYPAQTMAIMAVAKRWEQGRAAAVIAECGTGKTLISLGAVFVAADGKPFTALAMVPPIMVEKFCREALVTIPGVRVFVIDGVRNGVGSNGHAGVNEVRLRGGRIVREGFKTTLSEMRLAKGHRSARARWNALVSGPALFVLSRERGKLSYAWRHAYTIAASGPFLGGVINADTGRPVISGEDQIRRADFRQVKLSEQVAPDSAKARKEFFSPLWQADRTKVQRVAPAEFIGRYMKGFFDYFIADEVHELKSGETAQGNALGTLAAACGRTVVLTGTLMGGYADELYFTLFRLDGKRMRAEGFEYGESGLRQFAETYGVLEKITTVEPAENASSKGKTSVVVKRRPGASPVIFGKYLMNMAAFVSLEDIAEALPPYTEEVVPVEMDPALGRAYAKLEADITEALRANPGNSSVISTAMNALLAYPDRPFAYGKLLGYRTDEEGQRERFVISEPEDLDAELCYAKERRVIEDCKKDLRLGRRVQIFAIYTKTRDTTRRLQELLRREGIRCEVLTAEVPPEKREAWYESKLSEGMQVCIAQPRLCSVGIDLLWAQSIYWIQTGYSIYTLRQASRRSWRIGQKEPVEVRFYAYARTAQESCLRLMGRKLLVSLALEGKLDGGGLQAIEGDDDVLTAMARELVTKGVGEGAAAVWREVQRARDEQSGASVSSAAKRPGLESAQEPERDWQPQPRPAGKAEQMSLF